MLHSCTATFVLALASAATVPPQVWCASESPPYCQRDALDSEKGNEAYAFRDGNRCEGLYRLKLSGGSRKFVLRSLTSNRSAGSLADQADLEVTWPPLPAGVKLRISVVPLNSPILYRMDTEVNGAAGSFKWPARIVRGRFSQYSSLGVIASYAVDDERVYVACNLGPVSGNERAGLRADIFSLEPIRRLEVFSRPCQMPAGDCATPGTGAPVETLPGWDRDGAFAVMISSVGPAGSEFYSLRFAGQVASPSSPPIAISVTLRALKGAFSGRGK